MNILDVTSNAIYDDENIIRYEYHSLAPYASSTFSNNDEIRIPVHQQDIYTLPCESYLYIEGKLAGEDAKFNENIKLISNGIAFLFDEIRYEICGKEVDRVKNAGITSTMKNILTFKPSEANMIINAAWTSDVISYFNIPTVDFGFCIPLKLLMGFFEDYKRILLNVKQELVLIRSSSDNNAVLLTGVDKYKLTLHKIHWRIPFVYISDEYRLQLLKTVDKDRPITVAFRKWELHEYPSLPETKQLTWTIKTAAQTEKPRYVIVGLQTDRKNKLDKSASHFDFCKLYNIKLYLNSQYYPYDNLNGQEPILYDMYARFQSSYYYGSNNEPLLNRKNYMTYAPLIVIDCSKQNDILKTGSVDVRLEIETTQNIPVNTAAYCLLISDNVIEYTPLSGSVRKKLI